MLLSEAISLGATMRPQAFGTFLDADGRTCAMGAALDAIGLIKTKRYHYDDALDAWPWLESEAPVKCPVCHQFDGVWMIIADHMNNLHRCTREAIAEWVATIEPRVGVAEAVTAQEEVTA